MIHPSEHPLLVALEAPAAVVLTSGQLAGWNCAFADWATNGDDARLACAHVDVQGERGALALDDGERLPVALARLKGGNFLAQVMHPSRSPVLAMAGAFSERLGRIDRALMDALGMALREAPNEESASLLRDALAARDDLGALRRSVDAVVSAASMARAPVCLRTLVGEVARSMPDGALQVTGDEGDATVEIDSAHAFAHLTSVFGALHAHGACVLRAEVRTDAGVRLVVEVGEAASVLRVDPSLRDAVTFFAAQGAQLVVSRGVLVLSAPRWQPSVEVLATGGTILVVDDDPVTRAMMAAALRSAGWTVLQAENGVSASALLRRHAAELSLVVADAVLPGRSGMELLREATLLSPRVPVLLVSGHPSDLIGVDDAGWVPMLPKPFGARALTAEVGRLARVIARS